MRRFFRFSIRDLLWLTLVGGLPLGWWISARKSQAQWDDVYGHLDKLGERVQFLENELGVAADRDVGWKSHVVP